MKKGKGEIDDEIIMLHNYKLACIAYRKKVCSKCSSEQQKLRDCAIFRGFSHKSCRWMTLSVNRRKDIKKMNKKYIDNMMNEVCELRDNIHAVCEGWTVYWEEKQNEK